MLDESDKNALHLIFVIFFYIFLIAVTPMLLDDLTSELDKCYIKINHIGIVTDKWVKQDTAFFVFGIHDVFILEINNDFTKEVTDQIYYSTDIGDYRNWTTKELIKH